MASTPTTRLEELRAALREERISYGELVELQGLAEHIDPGDVELLEAAGVPERADEPAAYAYTFGSEAGETFQNVGRNHFVGYSARIYPHPELGGDPFDAAYLGPDDAEEWYDAVKFRRLDDVGEPIAGAPVESMRVARVHFF